MNRRWSLLLLVVAACAASQKPQLAEAPPRAQHETTMVEPRATNPEIERLSAEIEQKRGELGLAEPAPAAIEQAPTQPMASPIKDASCRPAKNDTCTASCTLGNQICDNATRICDIAKTLPADAWASNKCARANTTCSAASEKCCKCR